MLQLPWRICIWDSEDQSRVSPILLVLTKGVRTITSQGQAALSPTELTLPGAVGFVNTSAGHAVLSSARRQGTAFYDIRSPEDKVLLALKLILQGLSLRGVSNVLGVKLDTVRLWLTRSARHAEQVNDVLIKEIEVNRVELDELWSFVRKKNFRAWQKMRRERMGHAGSGSLLHQNTD